jgi:hypothetical protein
MERDLTVFLRILLFTRIQVEKRYIPFVSTLNAFYCLLFFSLARFLKMLIYDNIRFVLPILVNLKPSVNGASFVVSSGHWDAERKYGS